MIDAVLVLAMLLGSLSPAPAQGPAGGVPIPQHDAGVQNAQ